MNPIFVILAGKTTAQESKVPLTHGNVKEKTEIKEGSLI